MPESREQVVLFDFDSLWHINKDNDFSRISYSEGFSAPEQCKGHSSKIGKQSDVYAVGVLLYYKLFNQLSTINDTLTGAIYDYSRIDKIDINTYSSLVQEYLTLFFRKTMASSIHVRWNNMVPMNDLLKRILQATIISVVMKNFLVEYTTSKARFNLEIAEKELDDLNCETEWQYMQTIISYSDGFSAPKQVMGNIKRIGPCSDIYSIGAVLAYKLFGNVPSSLDMQVGKELMVKELSLTGYNMDENGRLHWSCLHSCKYYWKRSYL